MQPRTAAGKFSNSRDEQRRNELRLLFHQPSPRSRHYCAWHNTLPPGLEQPLQSRPVMPELPPNSPHRNPEWRVTSLPSLPRPQPLGQTHHQHTTQVAASALRPDKLPQCLYSSLPSMAYSQPTTRGGRPRPPVVVTSPMPSRRKPQALPGQPYKRRTAPAHNLLLLLCCFVFAASLHCVSPPRATPTLSSFTLFHPHTSQRTPNHCTAAPALHLCNAIGLLRPAHTAVY